MLLSARDVGVPKAAGVEGWHRSFTYARDCKIVPAIAAATITITSATVWSATPAVVLTAAAWHLYTDCCCKSDSAGLLL